MSSSEKQFDAVEMMRSARDQVSATIAGMTLDQEVKWLASQDVHDPFLERLRDRAAQPSVASAGQRARR
jgi:hypothetical protein